MSNVIKLVASHFRFVIICIRDYVSHRTIAFRNCHIFHSISSRCQDDLLYFESHRVKKNNRSLNFMRNWSISEHLHLWIEKHIFKRSVYSLTLRKYWRKSISFASFISRIRFSVDEDLFGKKKIYFNIGACSMKHEEHEIKRLCSETESRKKYGLHLNCNCDQKFDVSKCYSIVI